jgi:hypothetical protein
MRRIDVGWFYHYSDADGYAKILRRLDPAGKFEVVFDAPATVQQDRGDRSLTAE